MSTSTPVPEFEYEQPLAQSDIRLLRIERSQREDELRFSLEHHPRDNAPNYVALSYTWGHEPSLHKLLINDKLMKVRPNLWQALYYITTEQEALDKEWQYIWCDAVCINQSNLEEKSQQVREMYTTYRNAAVVVAWLGVDRSGKYDEYATVGHQKSKIKDMILKNYRDVSTRKGMMKEEILEGQYLNRMWIVQEAVAARKFIPLFGRSRLEVAHVYQTTTFLKSDEYKKQRQLLLLGFTEGTTVVAKFWAPLQEMLPDFSDMKVNPLIKWLYFTDHSVCSNPKDRIFALLNILPVQERTLLGHFFPDYELSLERIQLIVFAFLRHGGGQEFMRLQGASRDAKLSEALRLLRVRSKALQEELKSKSEMDETVKAAVTSHAKWAFKNPMQHAKNVWLDRPGDEAYLDARMQALCVIASQPLIGELHAQMDLLKKKSWYVPPNEASP